MTLEELHHRVNLIACGILGHKRSTLQTFVAKRAEPIGKRFEWYYCLRCGRTLQGHAPSTYHQFTEAMLTHYTPEFFAEAMNAESPLFKAMRR